MRRRELERRLVEWQGALGLLDWEIDVSLCAAEEMPDAPDDEGQIDYHVPDRTASISVRRGIANPELVLVHELLHLWFRTFAESRRNGIIEEQAIEAISKCLVGLRARCAA